MHISLDCNGRHLFASQPIIMGILNATPDSFYTQEKYSTTPEHILQEAERMIREGATILDIGGMSTRPNAPAVTLEEELKRVIPVIRDIKTSFPDVFISVDTFRAAVAQQAVLAGADMVNDISAGDLDEKMISTVASLNVPYIAMHMQGTPQTMQLEPLYENVTLEVLQYFIHKIKQCEDAGIKDMILDPGFGFGKTIAHNYQLLKELNVLEILNRPVLAGISRKSMIYKLLHSDAENALNGTTALNMIALQHGASILRVHDVKEAAECVQLFSYIQTI